MNVKFDITYSIEDAIKELGQDMAVCSRDEIIVIKVEDKFFMGGGCEVSSVSPIDSDGRETAFPKNVSVCMNSPFI
jgi:hypothetical protein